MIKNKKITIVAIVIILIIILGFLSYYFYLSRKHSEELSHPSCLKLTEEVRYEANINANKADINERTANNAKIYIIDKISDEVVFEFVIENIAYHYHPYEAHECGIYLVREFNFDYKKGKPLPGFRMEVWRYRYDGSGERLVEENDFRVNPDEKYIVFVRGHLGEEDYSLVIKNLKIKKDIVAIPIKNVFNKYPSLGGGKIDFAIWTNGITNWTKDGCFFWGRIRSSAYTLGFFRIDTQNWNVDIFEVPEGVLGGSALNIEKGYVTLHPDYIWIGIQEDYEQAKKEWQEQGKTSSLYLYNLFTKEKTLVETVEEPLWSFESEWISDTELKYKLPNGEEKVYVIEE